jgi:uncharacterized protein
MLTPALLQLSGMAWCGLLLVLLFGGSVKGSIGIGLPLLSVPLLTQFLDLPVAMGLLTVPLFATNVGQAFEGGGTMRAVLRLWPTMAGIALGAFAGVHLLMTVDRQLLYRVVGAVFVLLAVTMRLLPRLRLPRRSERWAGPPIGALSGLLGGVSGAFGPPLTVYLVGLGLGPDGFVKYTAILFTASTLSLMLALGGSGSLSAFDLLVSCVAMAPIWIGMVLGRWLRRRVPPALFRDAVLCAVALGGLAMLRRGFA